MRDIAFNYNSIFIGLFHTSDKVTPAFGCNFLDVDFTKMSQQITSIRIELADLSISQPVTNSKINPSHSGAYFNLEWLKYFAPKYGTADVELKVYFDNTLISTIPYILTAGRAEVEVKNTKDVMQWNYDWWVFPHEIVVICPTQLTFHWSNLECLVLKNSAEFWAGEGEIDFTIQTRNIILPLGYSRISSNTTNIFTISNEQEGINEQIAIVVAQQNRCCDIEIRITNRHGLRGVMGGKIIDTSEGGDDIKSNFDTITPYAGIFHHEKIGQKIQKEVFFDCGGDADLLGLLRDACVYGVCEWHDNVTEQWLPCQVVDNSLDTNPFKEQSITFILQQL